MTDAIKHTVGIATAAVRVGNNLVRDAVAFLVAAPDVIDLLAEREGLFVAAPLTPAGPLAAFLRTAAPRSVEPAI